MATLVYRYTDCSPPTLNGALAERHLRAAHRYRNLLIEIERGRRDAMREAERADAALAGVDAAMAMLDAERVWLGEQAKGAPGRAPDAQDPGLDRRRARGHSHHVGFLGTVQVARCLRLLIIFSD